MTMKSEFIDLPLAELSATSKKLKADGARFVQMLAVRCDFGYDLVYSFMKEDTLLNYRIEKVAATDKVPSITSEFLNAFVFENEAHDLFGVQITDIAIDFGGKFYALSETTPMNVVPGVKAHLAAGAAQVKKEAEARAAAAAKAAEEAKAKAEAEAKAKDAAEAPKEAPKAPAEDLKAPAKPADDKDDTAAKLEEKLKGMDPEKAAKVRAAMEAKAKKAAEAKEEK